MKSQSFKIYCAHCTITGKKYIGKTKQDFKKRIKQHFAHSKKLDYLFYRAINKHGFNSFIWGIIEDVSSENNLNEREEYWVSYFKTNKKEFGYNMTSGGEFGIPKEMMIEVGKKNGKYTYENKLGIFSYTKEEKSQIGKMGGTAAKMKGAGIHSLTSQQKSEYGRIGGMIMGERLSRNFELMSPDGILYTGKNMTNFCKNNNLTPSAICMVLNDKAKHHKGWTRPISLDTGEQV